jgi:hypothetical protein
MPSLNKKAFKLPYVEREKFMLLMKLGLDYNREKGFYRLRDCNNIEKLIVALSGILNGEEVTFLQNCTICGKDFPCQECKYYEHCTTKNLPFNCVCPQCLDEGKLLAE